ncbi:MAG TPA: hypothetical protein VFL61_08645 [Gaiellaceae bacterium]|nr:hypothetical protein [Gaiellaceae bacterium]
MRRFAWVPFAVALAAFALPFAAVSCDGLRAEPSGADLVLRTPPETTGRSPQRLDLGSLVVAYGGGLATAAFLAFALALLAALRPWDAGWPVLGTLTGLASLLFLKTRSAGGAEGAFDVEIREGAYLAFGAGLAGLAVGAAAWLREGRPEIRPVAPLAGALLVLFGYLYPSNGRAGIDTAYADTLNIREPWKAAFWLLPVVVATALLAQRRRLGAALAAFALGVFAVAGSEAAQAVWSGAGIGPVALLAGVTVGAAWAVAVQWAERRRPARLWLVAGIAVALGGWVLRP